MHPRTAAAAALLWFPAGASAHPFGANFAAQKLDVVVGDGAVRVTYLADVPNALVRTAARHGEDPIAAMLDELGTGLVVEHQGKSLTLEGRSRRHLQSTDDSQVLEVTLVAPLAECAGPLVVSNGNLEGVPSYFATTLQTGPGCALTSCGLFDLDASGRLRHDVRGRWRLGEGNRRLELQLAPYPGWWPVESGGLAVRAPWVGLLMRPVSDPRVLVASLALAGIAGATAVRGRVALAAGLCGGLMGALLSGSSAAAAEAGIGVAGVIAVLAALRRPSAAVAGVSTAIAAVCTHDPMLAALSLGAYGLGALLPVTGSNRATLGVAGLVAALATLRGGVELWVAR